MKSSTCKRRTGEIVRDFLVGLALFFTVFMLAMLDTRASHSATAVEFMPAPDGIYGRQNSFMEPLKEVAPVNKIAPVKNKTRLALKLSKRRTGAHGTAGAPYVTDHTWMIAVMALFFAAMTAITLNLWRNLRSAVTPKRRRRD